MTVARAYDDELGQCEQTLCKFPAGHSRAQQTRASCLLPRVLALHRFPAQQRNNSNAGADDQAKIDSHRTASGTQGRLRGALTSQEVAKHVEHCLHPGKAPGPDKCPNELLKTMSDGEFLIVQAWVNEILTLPDKTIDTARQSRFTMNGTISQLHKGGSTNKTSDQRPVVLLNSGYQLLNYIINERLKRIVEQTNVLESGQGGGRQDRSANINMPKMHFVTHEAHRQGKRVYRVDIDFRNAFNAMSQAALWHMMNMFHIPDVDLLEQIYDSATVRLAQNDAESATITFDTGVAQGSITSPQLFNILINALLRMLTATGQNQGISHGLQIGKDDQDDSSQDADHGYQLNTIGFLDDISIFAETPEGMQTLLDVVREFTTWCGMEINVKKTILLVIDKDRKQRESMRAPDLRINGECLKTLDINDTCRYLGYWGTGNGDMSPTREVVRENARAARDPIKSHPLTPELSAELFAQRKESAPSGSRQPSSCGCRVSWRVCKKFGYKRIKTHGTYHDEPQTLCTPSQLQRVAMSAPCRQEYSRRPCCSTLTNACGMKMS